MRLFIVLLFLPLFSFGQIITYDKLDGKKSPQEIDIRELTDTYITVELDQILPSCHLLSTSKHKNIQMRNGRKKKWNVYDEGILIRLVDRLDVLNFFSKYGYVLATSNTETYGVVSGNMILPFSDETITLMKKLD